MADNGRQRQRSPALQARRFARGKYGLHSCEYMLRQSLVSLDLHFWRFIFFSMTCYVAFVLSLKPRGQFKLAKKDSMIAIAEFQHNLAIY